MISVNYSQKEQVNFDPKDINDSILILGKAETEYNNLTLIKPKNLYEVEDVFGKKSELALAYKTAVNSGANSIYLCNCYKYTDYISALELISQNDFMCVVPLFPMDSVIKLNNNKEQFLASIYSDVLEECFSTIYLTGKHAKLYEDCDHFLRTYKSLNYKIKDEISNKNIDGANLACVLNNLSDYEYANVVLASKLSGSDLGQYPKNLNLEGSVIYDVFTSDLKGHELIFFAEDNINGITVENLLNYLQEFKPEKLLLNTLIINKINSTLDYNQFTGKLLNSYTRIEIENYTERVFQSFIGKCLESYSIENIDFIKRANSEVNINIDSVIKPYITIDKLNLNIQI